MFVRSNNEIIVKSGIIYSHPKDSPKKQSAIIYELININRENYERSEAYSKIKGRLKRARERDYKELNLKLFTSDVLDSIQCYSESVELGMQSIKFKEKDIRAMLHMLQITNDIVVKNGIINLCPNVLEANETYHAYDDSEIYESSCPLQYNLIREILIFIHDDLRYTLDKHGLGSSKEVVPSKLSLRAILNARLMDHFKDLLLGRMFRGEKLWYLVEQYAEYNDIVPWLLKNKCPYAYDSNKLKISIDDANIYGTTTTFLDGLNRTGPSKNSYMLESYEGDWRDGKKNGEGKGVFDLGGHNEVEIYEGSWKDDMRHGYGKLSSSLIGFVYEGDWKDDKVHGYGKMIYRQWNDGVDFDDDFTNEANWVVKCTFEGIWKNNRKDGYGKYTSSNGEVIEGTWVAGVLQGNNKQTLPNGDSYIGDFDIIIEEDREGSDYYITCIRNGHGKCSYANGIVYIGEWSNNKRHGQGYQTWPDGRTYNGEWSNDNLGVTLTVGYGRYSYPDGRSYDGQFLNGKFANLQDMEP